MAVTGIIVCTIAFLLFFLLLRIMVKSVFLCFVFVLASIVGLVLFGVGYEKARKSPKNNVRVLKYKLMIIPCCAMFLMVDLVSYFVIYRPAELVFLMAVLPLIFIAELVPLLVSFLMFMIKLKAARKADSEQKVCTACGSAVSGSMNFCNKCGSHLNDAANQGDSKTG